MVVSYNVSYVTRLVGERDRASTAVPWCWSHVRSRYRTPGPWQERGHRDLYHASLYGLGCNQRATTWRSGICEYTMEIHIAVFQIVRISLVTIHFLYLSKCESIHWPHFVIQPFTPLHPRISLSLRNTVRPCYSKKYIIVVNFVSWMSQSKFII